MADVVTRADAAARTVSADAPAHAPAPVTRPMPDAGPARDAARRTSGPFTSRRSRTRFTILVVVLAAAALALAAGYLLLDNPGRPGTTGHLLVMQRRATSLAVIAVVALCQGLATVAQEPAAVVYLARHRRS